MTILLTANVSMAADQTVTANPLDLLVGALNGAYEKSLGNYNSFLVSGSYYSWTLLSDKITGIGGGVGYRHYLGDEEFNGFFGQGSAGVVFASALGVSTTAFDVGGLAGYKWIFGEGFTLEAGAGASFVLGTLKGYPGFGGFSPTIMLSLGYSW